VDRSDYASARWPKSALPLVLYSRLYWPTNSIYRHSEGEKQPVNGILERNKASQATDEGITGYISRRTIRYHTENKRNMYAELAYRSKYSMNY